MWLINVGVSPLFLLSPSQTGSASQPQGVLQAGEQKKTQAQTGGQDGSQMWGQPASGAAAEAVPRLGSQPPRRKACLEGKGASKGGERGGAGRRSTQLCSGKGQSSSSILLV